MEIAASGGHSLLLIGSPGAGKSMRAKRMSTILPDLSPQERFAVAKIRSIVGEPQKEGTERPFRMIHHSCTKVAMLGGGKELVPGEITLAHNGVLFLDELAEFSSAVLDGLRQPIEDGNIVLSRASGSACYPCNFMLIAAANPCLCGRLLEGKDKCLCTPFQRDNYLNRISGPLLDRIDLRVNVFSMKYNVLAGKEHDKVDDMSSKLVRERVTKCRNLQMLRYDSEGINCNAHLKYQMLSKYCMLENDAEMLLQKVIDNEERSGRYYARVLKTARTISDMETIREMEREGREQVMESDLFGKKIGLKHVAEAIKYKVSNDISDKFTNRVL